MTDDEILDSVMDEQQCDKSDNNEMEKKLKMKLFQLRVQLTVYFNQEDWCSF